MTDTITLRYDGTGPRFRAPAFDIDVELGEEVTVDPDVEVPLGEAPGEDEPDDRERVSLVEFLTERGFERVTPAYDGVLEGTVDELAEALATGAHDDHLDALANAERAGQNRATALEAIHDRQTAVQEDD